MIFRIVTLSVVITCMLACSSSRNPLVHVSDANTASIITKGWDSVGGYERYQSIKRIQYTKRSVLYLEDGSTESDVLQQHDYTLHPTLSGTITSKDADGILQIHHGPSGSYKTLNGTRIEGSELSAERTFLSAHFVLFAPYKLADEGITVTHDGTATLDDGTVVNVIKVDYNPSVSPNHSTDDTWYMDFDQKTGSFHSNLVYHAPTYAFIENNERTIVDGMRFNTYRKSWRVDAERNKEFLRGEFWYSDYKLTFAQ